MAHVIINPYLSVFQCSSSDVRFHSSAHLFFFLAMGLYRPQFVPTSPSSVSASATSHPSCRVYLPHPRGHIADTSRTPRGHLAVTTARVKMANVVDHSCVALQLSTFDGLRHPVRTCNIEVGRGSAG